MITGVGADIIEVDRIKQALIKHPGFASKVFTEAERKYCRSTTNYAERFAGRFAAKEAVAKALGISLSWRDVEVLPDEHGKPVAALLDNAKKIAAGRTVVVSISHCKTYAIAYATAIIEP